MTIVDKIKITKQVNIQFYDHICNQAKYEIWGQANDPVSYKVNREIIDKASSQVWEDLNDR